MHRYALAIVCCALVSLWAVAAPVITGGFAPNRVYQVGEDDTASIALSGTGEDGPVEARWISRGNTDTAWQTIATAADGEWSGTLEGVPVGGPYTLVLRQGEGEDQRAIFGDIYCGDLWVLAGQSNMQGVGNNLAVTPPHPRVMVFAKNDEWRIAEEPLHRLAESPDVVHNRREQLEESPAPAVDVTGWTKGAGLGLAFATAVTEATGRPIGLIACAHGGTSMEQWDPAKRDEGGASLYGSMYRRVQLVGGEVTGLLWYQGESDANADAAPLYKDKFQAFIEAVRSDFNAPDLPFYYVQIGRFTNPNDSIHWDQVQHAQYELAAEMDAVEVVSAIDLALDDRIHIDTKGLQTLGHRFAMLALTNVYNANIVGSAPRLHTITRGEAPYGRYYRLTFDVPNGALTAPGLVHGFTIHDADGTQQVFKQEVDPDDLKSILLWVMQYMDDTTLHYGYGYDPVCTVVDTSGLSMPAFGPIPLPTE